MNYNLVFAPTAFASRLARKVFSVESAIALSIFMFELGCDAVESGYIVRGWYESARSFYSENRELIDEQFAPCVAVLVEVAAWVFGVERPWSAQNLPATVAAAQLCLSEAKVSYVGVGDRALQLVDKYLMG